jgi:hypothetical protein
MKQAGVVVHTSSSYSGGRDGEDCSLMSGGHGVCETPISTNKMLVWWYVPVLLAMQEA